jgi:transporter family protein
MSWVVVAISAYLLLAIANLLDKFLVDNVLSSSKAYAFVAFILGSIIFLAAPWFLEWPGFSLFFFNLANGCLFAIALCMLYEALRRSEASRILVFIVGATPIFSLLLSVIFFKEQFLSSQLFGIAFILGGVLLIAFLPIKRSYLARVMHKFNIAPDWRRSGLGVAIVSALAYSFYFISTKLAYGYQPFVSAFMWTRLGAALFVLLFLLKKIDRKEIQKMFQKSSPGKSRLLVVVNQGIGSLGFILQNYAIFLGSVVLVNALQGFQYAILLILSAVLALLAPKLLKETFSWRIITQKSLAVILIGVGIYLLTF